MFKLNKLSSEKMIMARFIELEQNHDLTVINLYLDNILCDYPVVSNKKTFGLIITIQNLLHTFGESEVVEVWETCFQYKIKKDVSNG